MGGGGSEMPDPFKHALEIMLAELESHRLEVCLAPSRRHDRRDWDMIRVCLDTPPRWYSKFCAAHTSSRGIRRGKHDTRIKRANTLRALNQMLAGVPAGKYEPDLARIARSNALK
jgi:hypothetical protein